MLEVAYFIGKGYGYLLETFPFPVPLLKVKYAWELLPWNGMEG